MSYVNFSDEANAACKKNNEKIIDEAKPYEQLIKREKPGNMDCFEGSAPAKMTEQEHFNYPGSDSEEFIALMLAQAVDNHLAQKDKPKKEGEAGGEGEGEGEGEAKPAADPAEGELYIALLDPQMHSLGISNKAHPSALNSVQFLYLASQQNAII